MRKNGFILGALALLAAACNSTNPVAPNPQQTPSGGAGSYSIALQPAAVEAVAGATSPVGIGVTVKRADTGQPPLAGTKVALSTDLGSFGLDGADKPILLASLPLDAAGQAQVDFFPGATTGTAHILAQVDTSTAKLNLPVKEPVVPRFFVSAVSPNFGSANGGTAVTITGGGFVAPVRVTFGAVVATVTSVADQTILAVAPRPAAPVAAGNTAVVAVTINNSLGGKTPQADTLAAAFTYSNGPSLDRPVVLGVSPGSGPNAGGTKVTLRGSGFDPGTGNNQVFFGVTGATGFVGLAADLGKVTSTEIVAFSPDVAALQPALLNKQVDILVRNLTTGFETTAAAAFRYVGQQLAVTSMSPLSGPYTGATPVTLQGQGFAQPLSVQFGGTEQVVDQVGPTTILAHSVAVAVTACKPPSGALTVKNLATGEMAATGIVFSYTVPQTVILQLSPTSGPQAGGGTVTITGSGFEANSRVEIGGIPATHVQVAGSGTSLTATIPAFTGTFAVGPCPNNQAGTVSLPKAVDVKVTSLATGCTDTFTLGFTYNPADTSCQPEVKGPPVANFVANANLLTVVFNDRSTGGT
ncbi:MAG TPA: IPT/TIG domain-containing protein, partial [Thermoanaerobaculia bacterium]|nr:IPT/TIG domain-containing protein [Thermoanaerobaculia bacterium]